jgi:hypothetical protein
VALVLAVAVAVAGQTVLVVEEATQGVEPIHGHKLVLAADLLIMEATNQMLILLMVVKATLRLQDFN